jgi:hypothetical protein
VTAALKEWQFAKDWSAAVFVDVGNAFNDWGEANRTGRALACAGIASPGQSG